MEKNEFHYLSSTIVKDTFNNYPNYIINKVSDSKVAVIYCASNGIYYPNEYDIFKRYMLEENRFEWTKEHWLIEESGLNIYIRDVFKQWYLHGINKEIDSLAKLITFLKKITEGYEVILIGSSAGGYIATLLGCHLNTKYVLNFSGQFDLSFQDEANIFVHRAIEEENPYINLKQIIEKSDVDIFYFVSKDSNIDTKDLALAKTINKNVLILEFTGETHGIPFDNGVLKKLLKKDKSYLLELYDKYNGKIINRYKFELNIVGVVKFFLIYYSKIKKKIWNRLYA